VHVSALGLRRIPYIWKGTLCQFGGFAIMPFALLVLSGYGDAIDAPRWIGLSAAALSFLLVGAGVHIVQTVGLALATDLVKEADQPKVVGLMYVMLLLGMVFSALVFGALLENYSPGRLIQVIQACAVLTVALNLTAMWKQETRSRARAQAMKAARPTPFGTAWAQLAQTKGMMRLLVVICLGTFGFGMADVLLEPYGGQALGMSVAETTKLTALFAGGTLVGFGLASRLLSGDMLPANLAMTGAAIGIPGFAAIIFASLGGGAVTFLAGIFLVGLGTGLFGHATLTATMRAAPKERIGLALGAWGAAQATSAGLGIALAGIVRDVVVGLQDPAGNAVHTPYNIVFSIEAISLAVAVLVIWPLAKHASERIKIRNSNTNPVEAS
jgi:BCD family chlorophyll transporter-like MFS transporter